jgi:hypothetical protein
MPWNRLLSEKNFPFGLRIETVNGVENTFLSLLTVSDSTAIKTADYE